MGIIIDIFLLVVIASAVIGGAAKGLIRSVMNMLTFIAAFVCAWVFTPMLSSYFMESIFMGKITGMVDEAVTSIIGSGIGGLNIDTLFSDMPQAFIDVLERFGANTSELERYYSQQATVGSENLTGEVATFIAQPIAQMISTVAAYLAIFLGIIIVLKIAAAILDIIFKLPGLSALNHIGGLLFGCVCGILYVSVFAALISAGWPALCALLPAYFEPGATDSSIIIGLADKYNIFSMLNFNFLGI